MVIVGEKTAKVSKITGFWLNFVAINLYKVGLACFSSFFSYNKGPFVALNIHVGDISFKMKDQRSRFVEKWLRYSFQKKKLTLPSMI